MDTWVLDLLGIAVALCILAVFGTIAVAIWRTGGSTAGGAGSGDGQRG